MENMIMITEADAEPTATEQLAGLLVEVCEAINEGRPIKHTYEEMLATIPGAIEERIAAPFVKRGRHD
jgi:hypothetical protein